MNERDETAHGGDRVARVLAHRGVPFVFTLCGGHVSPILVACARRGIRVVDVRHEATAVFAADAAARLGGRPGVAVVTAGPGATNTLTAVTNARLAQSAVVLLVGATATALEGRGALQDIDQRALLAPQVKSMASVRRVRDLAPAVELAFETASRGVPGPVAVECPVDLLYPEPVVRTWYGSRSGGGGLRAALVRRYLDRHVQRLFAGTAGAPGPLRPVLAPPAPIDGRALDRIAARLRRAERPVLLVGSQAVADVGAVADVAHAVGALGLPVYLSGTARGLLGRDHPLQLRHRRRETLREADAVVLAGVPCDFRLDYGRHIPRRAAVISINLGAAELRLNRRPTVALLGHPGHHLVHLAGRVGGDAPERSAWLERLGARDREREDEIRRAGRGGPGALDPLRLCLELEAAIGREAVIVADGGDFVATASYALRPRGPLGWLDPGPFGTLGVGAGFALAARLCRPSAEVWVLYGDGSVGFSIAEFDTFARHGISLVAVVGNDARWGQIERDQVEILGDATGCSLARSDYHRAAEALGGRGLLLDEPGRITETLEQARGLAEEGHAVLVNAHLGASDFRKGSISI